MLSALFDPVAVLLIVLSLTVARRFLEGQLIIPVRTQAVLLQEQARRWRAEAARHTTPDTFVHKAKAERKLVVIDKQLEQLKGKEAKSQQHWSFTALKLLQLLLTVAFAVYKWKQPVVAVWDQYLFWPLQGPLGAPHGRNLLQHGAWITAGPWVALCSRAAQVLLPPTG